MNSQSINYLKTHPQRLSSMPDQRMPRVSVIIPTYNHAQLVVAAILSVLNQDYEDYEIIVIDDGSQDDTRGAVAQFGSKVRYIWQENRGLSGARNAGINKANGELIGLLDADDLYEPTFLSTLVSLLNKNSQADAVYCTSQAVDMANNPLPQRIGKVVPPECLYETLLRGGSFPPSCMFAYKYCYQQLDTMFDESLQRVEDLELWLRISRRFNVIGIEKPLVRYRIMPQSLSVNPVLVLNHRIKVLQRVFGNGSTDESQWTSIQRPAIGRSYLAAAVEFLQLHEDEQAYQHMSRAFRTLPELTTELDVLYDLACGDQPRGFRGDFATVDVQRNARGLIDMLDRMFRTSPVLPELEKYRGVAYANAYFALGLLSYGAREFPKTRRFFFSALVANPGLFFNRQLTKTLVKSLLPVKLVDWLKQGVGR